MFYGEGGHKVSFADLNRASVVTSVEINISRSKADQLGLGRLVRHVRVDTGCCIVREIFNMVINAKERHSATVDSGMLPTVDGLTLVVEDDVCCDVLRMENVGSLAEVRRGNSI
jgi:hypothetical protein